MSSENNPLTHEQLALLNNAETVRDPRIVAGRIGDGLARLDDDDLSRLADARTPTVIDAVETDPNAIHDALDAMEGMEDPVVVDRAEAESIDAARDALATALVVTGRVTHSTAAKMSLDALTAEYEELDSVEESPAVAALSQMPETGGVTQDEIDESYPLDDLSLTERDEICEQLKKADDVESRIPKRAAAIRRELAEAYGVESVDELVEVVNVE